MAERLPTFKALPNVLAKAFSMLEDEAHKVVSEIGTMTDEGISVIRDNVGSAVKETRAAFADVKQQMEGTTNGGPLSEK